MIISGFSSMNCQDGWMLFSLLSVVTAVWIFNYWTNEDAEVRLRGITYHLYKYHFVNIRKLISFELVFSKERAVQKKIHHIIQEIAPDVIHLFGSENIGYSCGIVPYAKNKNVVISICQEDSGQGLFPEKYHFKLS